jgi:hypothetical protein
MKFAVDENARVEIRLSAIAKRFIFFHDASVGVCDGAEVFFRRVLIAVDFVVDFGVGGGRGHELLDHHEMGAGTKKQRRSVEVLLPYFDYVFHWSFGDSWETRVCDTYETDMETLGK